jgi:hypothetical protein
MKIINSLASSLKKVYIAPNVSAIYNLSRVGSKKCCHFVVQNDRNKCLILKALTKSRQHVSTG